MAAVLEEALGEAALGNEGRVGARGPGDWSPWGCSSEQRPQEERRQRLGWTTGWMTLPSRTYIKQEEGREDTSVVLCLLNPGYIREKMEIKQLDIMF